MNSSEVGLFALDIDTDAEDDSPIFEFKTKPVVAPKGINQGNFLMVISATYDAYLARNQNGLPSIEEIAAITNLSKYQISRTLATDEFILAMKQRGINWELRQNQLQPEQSYLISILTNPTDRRNLGQKLKAAGVSYARYRGWLKQPLFANFLNQRSEGMLSAHQGDVLAQMVRRATEGDLNAIKFYLEVTGRHNPAKEQQVNLQAFMMQVIEIITRNVTDRQTLDAIASDMAALGFNSGTAIKGEVIR